MKEFKRKLIKGLSAFLLAGAFLFPKQAKAQERVIIDNFSQPNDTILNYYGSGDVNKDNVLNWEDYYAMGSVQNDMSDIDGDGTINQTDKQILKDKLNGLRDYLPAYWNKLGSLEKQNWFENMVEIDKTDKIITSNCYEWSIPFAINFHGFKSLEGVDPENFPYKFSKNNRFNIPVYTVSTTTTSGSAHSINGVLIGDNPFEFSNWSFIDPSRDNPITPGNVYMADTNNVEINYLSDMNPEDGGTIGAAKIIKWSLDENGNPTLLYTSYIKHIIPSNPNKDIIAPEVNLSISDSSYYNSNVNLEYLVKENQTFLDSAYYELNGIKKNLDCFVYATDIISAPVDLISGTEPLASSEGEYNLVFYANDIAKPQGNSTQLERYFVIDKTSPTTSDNIPEAWQNSDFNVTLTPKDTLSGVVSTKYCISSTNDCTPDIEYTSPVSISEEGEKYFRYFSTDKARNNQPIVSREIKLDKTAPEISATLTQNPTGDKDLANVSISVLEANPDYTKYSYNDSDWVYFKSDTSFNVKLRSGENVLNVEAKDKVGWNSDEKVTLVTPDAVEEPVFQEYSKAYPNPTTGPVNFEFYLNTPENLRFNVYDMTGKELENIVVEGNPGENKILYNFSEYSSGFYIYRLGDKTGKIIKR